MLGALSALPLIELDAATIKRIGEAYYVHLVDEDDEQRIAGFSAPEQLPDDPTPTFEEYVVDCAEFDASARHGFARGRPMLSSSAR